MIVRVAFGDHALSVNYGYNATVPEDYFIRLTTPASWPDLIERIWLAFGLLWVGVLGIWRGTPKTRITGVMFIVLVLIGTLLLSSRITRVLGILYVVLIPGFLSILESNRPQEWER